MTPLSGKRILASFIDYVIIISYAAALFFITTSVYTHFNWQHSNDPYNGQLIGFFTLTLPVFVYSFASENSRWRATIGKKLLKLKVKANEPFSTKKILTRNVLKFLPWEIAHTGVHWAIYYSTTETEIPYWTWGALILPQVVVAVYFFSILLYKGRSSVYDNLARTTISNQ